MKLVVFGLSVSSSWGNGHATLWRGLCRALGRRGHEVVFFERDVPYYRRHRDLWELDGGWLVLYPDWEAVEAAAVRELAAADAAIVTSYCPDALPATQRVLDSRALRVFYDLDSGVTLHNLRAGVPVPYIGERGLQDFDLVLSYTGGRALADLRTHLGARRVAPLYGSVDPEVHAPVAPAERYRSDLSYIATYAPDRHQAVIDLLVETAIRRPDRLFLIAGPQYPLDFPWQPNIHYIEHVPPADHPRFYCSARFTLNLTRGAMAEVGWCPSGRMFEAAAAGVPMIGDRWPGLEEFFEPGSEMVVATRTDDVLAALDIDDHERERIARAARERVLGAHTAAHRAEELERLLEAAHGTGPSRRRNPSRTESYLEA